MEWKALIALILGTVGTTLGVINLIRSMWDNRVQLRVIPSLSYIVGGATLSASRADQLHGLLKEYGMPSISIEVINVSKFPVTISEVGLCEGTIKRTRAPFLKTRVVEGPDRPWRLGPREAITILSTDEHAHSYSFTRSTRAYATTSCDTTKFGTSHALDAWTQIASQYTDKVVDS